MSSIANDIALSFLAMSAYSAMQRGELIDQYHCGMVCEEDWMKNNTQEDILTVLSEAVVGTYQPANAFMEFEYSTEDGSGFYLPVFIFVGPDQAAYHEFEEVAGADEETELRVFLTSVVAQLNQWFEDNKKLGRAYYVDNKLKVVAQIDNDLTFGINYGGQIGEGSLSVTKSQNFKGAVSVGCMSSHCNDGDTALANTYRLFQQKFLSCCVEPINYVKRACCYTDPYTPTLDVEIVDGIMEMSAASKDPMCLGNFNWELTILDSDGNTWPGYPTSGNQDNFPQSFSPLGDDFTEGVGFDVIGNDQKVY